MELEQDVIKTENKAEIFRGCVTECSLRVENVYILLPTAKD